MRTLLRKRSLYFLMAAAMVISMCACSAKSSADTENTTAEAETKIETEEETEEETVDASGNDPSGNDVSDNDVSENDAEEETEEETEDSPESKTNAASEEEEEEEIEEESTNSKTSEKDSTKSETTTSETTTEAVTVQSVSAVVNGTHYVGETLTGADFTVTVKMSDGETLTNPAGWSAQPLTLNSTSNLITVAYEGASVTITVPASVQTASNSGSGSSGSTGSTSGTTAGSTTNSTTSATTSTTQSSTTSATTSTTAATTQAETTTAAPTTTETEATTSEKWNDGDYEDVLAQALFIAQNETRAEAGVDNLIWDDQCYEIAKLSAKACGDAGYIDHALTAKYQNFVSRTTSTGETILVVYGENLQRTGANAYKYSNLSDAASEAAWLMSGVKDSPGHYSVAIGSSTHGAVAVYRMNGTMFISYIFYDYYDCEVDGYYFVDEWGNKCYGEYE